MMMRKKKEKIIWNRCYCQCVVDVVVVEVVSFSSFCSERSCPWPTNPGTSACEVGALFGPFRNTWPAHPDLNCATVQKKKICTT